MKIKDKERLRLRKIGDRYIVVNTSGHDVNMREVFTLNEPSAFLFEKARTADEFDAGTLIGWLTEEYDVSMDKATCDVTMMVEAWRRYGLVESETGATTMETKASRPAAMEAEAEIQGNCSTQEAFLRLIRCGLWEDDGKELEGMVLSGRQWNEILALARRQTLAGLLWRGMDIAAGKGVSIPGSISGAIAVDVDRCESHYRKMAGAVRGIFREYEKKGLHPVLLKGIAAASLHAHPELRECGDIDIWMEKSELETARPAGGKRSADGSYVFVSGGETIELHDHILDIERPGPKKIAAGLADSYGFEVSDGIRTTSPQLTMLLLNAHILKHTVGRGIGLRQICDYAVAHERLLCSEEALRLYEADVERLKISRWTRVLDCFCQRWLGMESPRQFSAGDIALSEKLLARVMEGGNFGFGTRKGTGALNTAADFIGNLRLSLKLAPSETVWTILSLMKGRLS